MTVFSQDWQAIKYLIGRTGKLGLRRLVGKFGVNKLKIETALQAYLILKKFTLEDVKDISVGVATFYVWVSPWLIRFRYRQYRLV